MHPLDFKRKLYRSCWNCFNPVSWSRLWHAFIITNFLIDLGAKGGVCALANIAPRELVSIQKFYEEGKAAEALHLQQLMVAPNRAVTAK